MCAYVCMCVLRWCWRCWWWWYRVFYIRWCRWSRRRWPRRKTRCERWRSTQTTIRYKSRTLSRSSTDHTRFVCHDCVVLTALGLYVIIVCWLSRFAFDWRSPSTVKDKCFQCCDNETTVSVFRLLIVFFTSFCRTFWFNCLLLRYICHSPELVLPLRGKIIRTVLCMMVVLYEPLLNLFVSLALGFVFFCVFVYCSFRILCHFLCSFI